jgi:hypothetical protein
MLTTLRKVGARIRLAWRLSWGTRHATDRRDTLAALDLLLDSAVMEGAIWAVQKTGLDVSLKGAQNEMLRAEAVEWAGHWCAEHHVGSSPWQVRVCVELAVGQLKGYL